MKIIRIIDELEEVKAIADSVYQQMLVLQEVESLSEMNVKSFLECPAIALLKLNELLEDVLEALDSKLPNRSDVKHDD